MLENIHPNQSVSELLNESSGDISSKCPLGLSYSKSDFPS